MASLTPRQINSLTGFVLVSTILFTGVHRTLRGTSKPTIGGRSDTERPVTKNLVRKPNGLKYAKEARRPSSALGSRSGFGVIKGGLTGFNDTAREEVTEDWKTVNNHLPEALVAMHMKSRNPETFPFLM